MALRVHTQRTVIAGVFAGWTGSIKLHATDAADVVFRHVPAPRGYGVPFFDCDFHTGLCESAIDLLEWCYNESLDMSCELSPAKHQVFNEAGNGLSMLIRGDQWLIGLSIRSSYLGYR